MSLIFEDRENIPILDAATKHFNINVLPVLDKEFSQHENNTDILFHSVKAGKRLRPFFCQLAFTLAGGQESSAANYASAAMELIHCSSLLIDDELDSKGIRPDREMETVRNKFSPQEAMFTGACLELLYTYNLLVKASENLPIQRRGQILGIFSETYSEAVTRELEKWKHIENKDIVTKEHYWEHTHFSSGLFFGMCGRIGASLATEDEEKVKRLWEIGNLLGQILGSGDDVKDLKEDMLQGYYSLAVIDYSEKTNGEEGEKLRKSLASGLSEQEVDELYEKMVDKGSIEYSLSKLRHKMDLIKEHIDALPEGEDKKQVDDLTDFLALRMKLKE
jgi:geranylgeranyl pyrophosphate synthase